MARRNPTQEQRRRLVADNADRCCVCKRDGVGLHLHHIDGDATNTVDGNLAVLCVEDHDRHHRPSRYTGNVRHVELSVEEISSCKTNWERFVRASRTPGAPVLATVTVFGTTEHLHSAQLVLQWADGSVEHARSFHLLEGTLERWVDEIAEQVDSIGAHLQLALVDGPQAVEHCPSCGSGKSRTVDRTRALMLTDSDWKVDSVTSIYVNPDRPSLALTLALGNETLQSGSLHLCQGRFLHYQCDQYEERLSLKRQPSIRTQATKLVERIIREWQPARVVVGTGEPDSPEVMNGLDLPLCWESPLEEPDAPG